MYIAFYIEFLFSADRDTQKKLLSPKDADIVKLAAESVSFSMVRYQTILSPTYSLLSNFNKSLSRHPFEKLVSAYLNKVMRRC